jgi:hypothetical protein
LIASLDLGPESSKAVLKFLKSVFGREIMLYPVDMIAC